MAAVFGAKVPHSATYIAGGMTPTITTDKVAMCKQYLSEVAAFVNNVYIPDVQAVANVYSDYLHIGAGYENLLAYGCFEQADGTRLLRPGVLAKGQSTPANLDTGAIQEHVTNSWYQDAAPVGPSNAATAAQYPKGSAYSWVKSPRYNGEPYEAGALARMKVSGHYSGGVSTMDRFIARAQEASLIARAMQDWLNQLSTGSAYDTSFAHKVGLGEGLTEAPRGALGHWVKIGLNGKISHYQIITPTCWNTSPQDDQGKKGPLEQALIGIEVLNESKPIEVLRVIHSFDPCLACAVHVLRPNGKPIVIAKG
jgi:hydrogenase large subunit